MTKLNIDDLTFGELKQISNLFNKQESCKPSPYIIGTQYFIRTVTMILVGKLEKVYDDELVLSEVAWVADTGRFSDALKKGESVINEIEPFPDDVIVGRKAIVDATIWGHELLKKQK